jgi:glycosyltransferase involved in cell wall biosynthesis
MYWISDHRLSTVYNGIDYNFRDSSQISQHDTSQLRINHSITDSYIGLYFGRMGVAKGMDDVLKAIPHIIRHIPNYKQVFITPKKQSSRILWVKNTFSIEEVEQFIKEHQLESHIIWIESVPREELRSWIKTVSVVILPSRAEWFGFAVSEVCALWGNLITTNVASIPEVVYGNVNFVEPNNEYDISQKVFDFYHNKYETITERKFERGECIKDTSRLYQLIIKKWK